MYFLKDTFVFLKASWNVVCYWYCPICFIYECIGFSVWHSALWLSPLWKGIHCPGETSQKCSCCQPAKDSFPGNGRWLERQCHWAKLSSIFKILCSQDRLVS